MEGPVPFLLGESSTAKLLTKDEARLIEVNIVKLPELTPAASRRPGLSRNSTPALSCATAPPLCL
jgi:hypothetical protein